MSLNPRGAVRRTALGAVCATTILLVAAAPAGAGAPTRIDAEYWGVSCVADLGGGNVLFLFGGGTTDGSEGGIGAFVEDATGAQVAEGQATDFAFGSTFRATVPLGTTTFTIAATVSRGPSTTEQVDERDGNAWTKGTTAHADLTLSGTTATYAGAPVALGETSCSGDVNGFHVRTTNPAASIHRSSDFASDICEVNGLRDGQVRITGALPRTYVEVVADHGGEDVEKAQGEVVVRGGRGSLSTEVVDLFSGEVRTTARIGLTLTRSGKTVRQEFSDDGMTERWSITPYRATITVVLADGRQGTARCRASAVTTSTRVAPTH